MSDSSNQEEDLFADIRSLIGENEDEFVTQLRKVVEVDSISSVVEGRSKCREMTKVMKEIVESCGGTMREQHIGFQLAGKENIELPKIFMIDLREPDPAKPTIAVYGFYDVLPTEAYDKWNSEPFELTELNGNLHGRGTAAMKGIILPWILIGEVYQLLERDPPANVKILLEGMGETNSEYIEEVINQEAVDGGFLSAVDAMFIPQHFWITDEHPSVASSMRGLIAIEISVTGKQRDIFHAGAEVPEFSDPIYDLVIVVNRLLDGKEKLTNLKNNRSKSDKDSQELKLCLNSFETSNTSGSTSVRPHTCVCRMSMRPSATEDIHKLAHAIEEKIEAEFKKIKSTNIMQIEIEVLDGLVFNPRSLTVEAAVQTIAEVYEVDEDEIFGGVTENSKPVPTLADALGDDMALVTMGTSNDRISGENESISRDRFLDGLFIAAAFVENYATLFSSRNMKPRTKVQNGPLSRRGTKYLMRRMQQMWKGLS